MVTALGLLAVVALIAANGYFVAAEFSFVASRRARLEELAEAGDRRAVRSLEVSNRLSFVLSGAQLGITATSLLVGYVAEPSIGRLIQPVLALTGVPEQAVYGLSLTVGFVTATGAQMVFGELAPKNLAIARAESVALALAYPTWWYTRLAGPFIRLFDSSSNRLLRLLGIEPIEYLPPGVPPEELEYIVEESSREGTLTDAQAALLGRVLEFRSLRAADAMVPRTRVVSIAEDATCEELRRLAVDTGHSRFPAVDADDLDDVQGVVQAKDIFRVDPDARARTPVRTLLQPSLEVPETTLLGPLLGQMRQARSPLAVVVDEYGGTAGVITIEDVVEELVGEIRDEYDTVEPRVSRVGRNRYLVPGSLRLDETTRATGVTLPTGDYETVSGLVMAELGRLPQPGDVVELDTARLRVQRLDGHAVGQVRLEAIEPAGEEGRG